MKLLILLAAAAATLPVAAQTPARSQIVHFADLEIGSVDGRAALASRIRHAADAVCGNASDFDLVGQNRLYRCRADAVAAAEQKLSRQLAVRRGTTLTVAAR